MKKALLLLVALSVVSTPASALSWRSCANAVVATALAITCAGSVGCGPSPSDPDRIAASLTLADREALARDARTVGEGDKIRVGAEVYFVRNGFVFRYDGEGRLTRLPNLARVVGLVAYKGQVVARQAVGGVYLWSAEKAQWLEIGARATAVTGEGEDLYLARTDGALLRYQGTPGPVEITYVYIPQPIGDVMILQPYPVIGGRKLAFDDTGVRNVAGFDGVNVKFKDGAVLPVAQVGR